jgi:hypothetical protein
MSKRNIIHVILVTILIVLALNNVVGTKTANAISRTVRGIEIKKENQDSHFIDESEWQAGRINPDYCNWENINPSPGVWDWSCENDVLDAIDRFRENGIEPIVVFHSAPTWVTGGKVCDAVPNEHHGDYKRFVRMAIERWEVQKAELWNEPNGGGEEPDYYGCWGNTFQKGKLFGLMMLRTYAYLQAYTPGVEIWLGGLTHGAAGDPLVFLDGILTKCQNYGSPCFDKMSFHQYAQWAPAFGTGWAIDWEIDEEAQAIKDKLAEYGYGNREIWLSEFDVLYNYEYHGGDCYYFNYWQAKELFARDVWSRALDAQLGGAIYYGLWGPETWFCNGIIKDHEATNVYLYWSYNIW